MGFEILASVIGVKAEEVYKLVDTHMTDSTAHNKGLANLQAEMYNLETPAGQLFWDTHYPRIQQCYEQGSEDVGSGNEYGTGDDGFMLEL